MINTLLLLRIGNKRGCNKYMNRLMNTPIFVAQPNLFIPLTIPRTQNSLMHNLMIIPGTNNCSLQTFYPAKITHLI